MSMNWTQYLLGKLAEEASEVVKEALKCQQHGVASQYKGRNAIMELRNEFLELTAVIEMLEERKDVGSALGVHHINPVTGHDVCQDDDHYNITSQKMARLCYFAMLDYDVGQLTLTMEEFVQIQTKARTHVQLGNNCRIDHIRFRGMGSYYRESIIDPPVGEPMVNAMAATMRVANVLGEVRDATAGGTGDKPFSLQMPADQVEFQKKAIALVDDLFVAEWLPADKPEMNKSHNADGTVVYSWAERGKGVRVHMHLKPEHYDIIHTDIKTGRHISTDRGEYKTF